MVAPGIIHIIGYASPDGGYELNQRLARERAQNLAAYLKAQINIPDSLLDIRGAGINWQGLDRVVGESSLSKAQLVQSIIRNEPEITYNNGVVIQSRKQQLQKIDNGRTWRWMMENLYPSLRSSGSVVCYIERIGVTNENAVAAEVIDIPPIESPADSIAQPEAIDSIAAPSSAEFGCTNAVVAELETIKYPIFALRSNLLVPLLNVGIEVPVAEHWSIGADYYYPWIWPSKKNKNCFELIFVSAEARYWFNPNKGQQLRRNYLTGHSVAVYGAWGYYDLERNWHGHQGHGWSVGADYMFALPIAKGRLRLEFEIAIGALWSPKAQPYRVYESGGLLIKDLKVKSFSYVGPTKIGVSLVLPINRTIQRPAIVNP